MTRPYRASRSALGSLWLVVAALAATPGAAEVGLSGPQVTKLAWNSRAITAGDFNDDGRQDLALIDNDRARIDVLIQRHPGEKPERRTRTETGRWNPVLDDALFRVESFSVGGRAFDLVSADMDDDGRSDLIFTGRPDGLTIRYQDRQGRFTRSTTIELEEPSTWRGTLCASDVDSNGRTDLVVLGTDALTIFLQREDGHLASRDRYPLTEADRYGLQVLDIDGDGALDLLYQVTDSDRTARVRLGNGSGDFGSEIAVYLSTRRGRIKPLSDMDGAAAFISINHETSALETVRFSPIENTELPFDEWQPRVITTRTAGRGGPSSTTPGDFDGNGRIDLAVADSRAAALTLLYQIEPGRFDRSDTFPSLAEVKGMAAADFNGDGRDDLVLVSPTEGAVSWTTLNAEGRLVYPVPLDVGDGKPLVVTAGPLRADAPPSVATVIKEKKNHRVVLATPEDTAAESWSTTVIELESLRISPKGIALVDANQDGLRDLIVFTAHEPARVLIQDGEGRFSPASQASGFQRGLLDDIEPSTLTTGDVDGDGSAEILVAHGRFVRALRLTADGVLEVVDQFNSQQSGDELEAGVVWTPSDEGRREIALIAQRATGVETLRRDRDSVYRSSGSITLDALDFQHALVTDLGHGPGRDLLLIGTEAITWLPSGGEDLRAETTVVHETDPLEIRHSLTVTGDLTGEGRPDIVAIDATESRILEVLQQIDGEWTSVLRFTLFAEDPHYQGQTGGTYEPREGLITDVTGDGLDDLILLVHDRLLVYPQVETETAP